MLGVKIVTQSAFDASPHCKISAIERLSPCQQASNCFVMSWCYVWKWHLLPHCLSKHSIWRVCSFAQALNHMYCLIFYAFYFFLWTDTTFCILLKHTDTEASTVNKNYISIPHKKKATSFVCLQENPMPFILILNMRKKITQQKVIAFALEGHIK